MTPPAAFAAKAAQGLMRSFGSLALRAGRARAARVAPDRRRDRARRRDDPRRPAAGGDDQPHLHRPLRLGLRPRRPDRLRRRQEDSLPKRAFGEVERTAGRRRGGRPDPRASSRWSTTRARRRPTRRKQLNVAGQDPEAADVTDSETVAGRDPERGREISIQDSWADANDIRSRRPHLAGDARRRAPLRGRRPLPVLERLRVRRRGLRGDAARRRPRADGQDAPFDEIDVIVAGGEETIASLERRLEASFGKGVQVETPQTKAEDVESQLQAFNAILYFFAAMALFVGGFLIFNAFNMTVLQRTREIGMLRTLGTPRPQDHRLGPARGGAAGARRRGARAGPRLALALRAGRVRPRARFPRRQARLHLVGAGRRRRHRPSDRRPRRLTPRAGPGKTSPIRAVLGTEGLRPGRSPRRAVLGIVADPARAWQAPSGWAPPRRPRRSSRPRA